MELIQAQEGAEKKTEIEVRSVLTDVEKPMTIMTK